MNIEENDEWWRQRIERQQADRSLRFRMLVQWTLIFTFMIALGFSIGMATWLVWHT